MKIDREKSKAFGYSVAAGLGTGAVMGGFSALMAFSTMNGLSLTMIGSFITLSSVFSGITMSVGMYSSMKTTIKDKSENKVKKLTK